MLPQDSGRRGLSAAYCLAGTIVIADLHDAHCALRSLVSNKSKANRSVFPLEERFRTAVNCGELLDVLMLLHLLSAKLHNQIESDSVKHLASDCKIAQCNRIRTIAINRLKRKVLILQDK